MTASQCGIKTEGGGVHSFKLMRDALAYSQESWTMYGSILMWGETVEHELGYRAEYARIASLMAPFQSNSPGLKAKRDHWEEVCRLYGVLPVQGQVQ
jgi:hypothetical protein